MFVCILLAHQRQQNAHKHVEKEVRLRRNVYGAVAIHGLKGPAYNDVLLTLSLYTV
jgi:hypothetical protein